MDGISVESVTISVIIYKLVWLPGIKVVQIMNALTDTGEDSKLVHRRKRPKVDASIFLLLFFRRVRATSMTQRRVENTRVHFWTYSPVSINPQKSHLIFKEHCKARVKFIVIFKNLQWSNFEINFGLTKKFVIKIMQLFTFNTLIIEFLLKYHNPEVWNIFKTFWWVPGCLLSIILTERDK